MDDIRNQQVSEVRNRHPFRIRLSLVVIAGLCIALLVAHDSYTSYDVKRIGWTFAMLNRARGDIEKVKRLTGEYPDSLLELRKFGEQNPDAGIRKKQFREYISRKEGCSTECSSLNNKGGWYYDKNSGQIRVNLTTPVNRYLRLYFGKERNEIPADW